MLHGIVQTLQCLLKIRLGLVLGMDVGQAHIDGDAVGLLLLGLLETSIAKLYATEAAVRSANTAIQVHGGSGYVDDHPVERYFRDVRVTTLYEGTSQIQKLIIGRAVTGINALVPS